MKGVHVCSFQAVPDVRKETTYRGLKAAVLKAGRFSVFEATATTRAAKLFTRLCADPDLEMKAVGFPWTEVTKK